MLQAQTDCSVQQQPRVVGCGLWVVGERVRCSCVDRGCSPALCSNPTGQNDRGRDRTLKPTCTCLYLYRVRSKTRREDGYSPETAREDIKKYVM